MEKLSERFRFLFDLSLDSNLALLYPKEVHFGEIRKGAWSVCKKLSNAKVPQGAKVMLLLKKGKEFCIGFFGTLLHGALPVLIDPEDDMLIREYVSKIEFAITTHDLSSNALKLISPEKIITIDEKESETKSELEDRYLGYENPFCVLLTSGSTGKPKEVIKTFGNIFFELEILWNCIHKTTSSDSYLCAVPWIHIYGFLNGFLMPLIYGARVSFPSSFFPAEIEKVLDFATVFVGVPVQYKALIETGSLNAKKLRLALSSGAKLPHKIASKFMESAGIPITDIYGSTEMGGVATRKSPLEESWKPLSGVEWKSGEDGELLVRSPFVAKWCGEKTDIDDSWNCSMTPPSPADRHTTPTTTSFWFPSGDYIETDSEGRFFLKGRKKEIIKVGGRRVSSTEIENAILKTEVVKDVAVIPIWDEKSACEKIGACVVFYEGKGLNENLLKKLLKEYLPIYKIPDRIAIVEKIPRNKTGKVNLNEIEKLLIKEGK